jgi:hypothetical protein
MFKSSYAELEAKATKGRMLVFMASAIHLTASLVSALAINPNVIQVTVTILIQVGFCAALLAGKNWARWVSLAFNLVGASLLVFWILSGNMRADAFYVARMAICLLVVALLLAPPTKSYIIWKKLRF